MSNQTKTTIAAVLVLVIVAGLSYQSGIWRGQGRTRIANMELGLRVLYESAIAGGVEPLRRSGMISDQIASELEQAERRHGRVASFHVEGVSFPGVGSHERLAWVVTDRGGTQYLEKVKAFGDAGLHEISIRKSPSHEGLH